MKHSKFEISYEFKYNFPSYFITNFKFVLFAMQYFAILKKKDRIVRVYRTHLTRGSTTTFFKKNRLNQYLNHNNPNIRQTNPKLKKSVNFLFFDVFVPQNSQPYS